MTGDFRSYPLRCKLLHQEACQAPGSWVTIGSWKKPSAVASEIRLFQRYRHLIRKNPGVDFTLDKLMAEYEFRTKTEQNAFGDSTLLLIARQPLVTSFLSLNPELSNLEI